MTEAEVLMRLSRQNQFHFTGEHKFWSPKSATELAWFYRISSSYLFANAIHGDESEQLGLTANDGPVLDYSGGVGNTVLGLASKGIPVTYFGIGIHEYEFARFRVRIRGLEGLVTFLAPFAPAPGGGFDPIGAIAPGAKYKTILLIDVLEHIPDYHLVLRHLVGCLAPGGIIIEDSPFGNSDNPFAVHVKASVPMSEAMAGMEPAGKRGPYNVWKKVT